MCTLDVHFKFDHDDCFQPTKIQIQCRFSCSIQSKIIQRFPSHVGIPFSKVCSRVLQTHTLESGIDGGSGINGGGWKISQITTNGGSGINGVGGKFPKSKERGE